MDWWIVTLTLGQLAFVGFIIWVVSRSREARMRQRSEERARLLERFSSSQELTDFLNSEAGARLLTPQKESSHPTRMVVGAAMGGIITLFVGLAFVVVVFLGRDPSGGNLMVPAAILVMAGIGLLVAAAVSAWLFRRSGLTSDSRP